MSKVLLSEEKMKELAKSVSADETTFVSYYKIFQALYESLPATQFTNYFHGTSLFQLGKVNKINNEDSFYKAIASFINEISADKKKLYKIYLEFSTEESVQNIIKVLKMLKEPKSFLYYLNIAKPKTVDIDFIKFPELFNYIENVDDPQFFNDFVPKIIEQQIDVAKLYYVNLDEVPSDKVIDYCTKYPNRIKELYSFENKDYDKIKKICDLNAESLIRIPNCKLDLYSNLKKIEIVTINSEPLPEPLPENFNYASVKNLETIFIEDEEKTNFAIELINKCPNVEIVSFATFCELSQEQFFNIFTKTTSKKIKEIIVTCQEFEENVDFTPIFKNLPNLTKFRVDCHCSMDFLFGIHPIISCEKVAPSYQIIEQLITNYLKVSGFSRGCYACWHQLFHSLDYAKWYMPFSANISSATEMGLDMPVEEQMQLLKDALNAQADFKDSFFIYAACGGKRDMMYDVNAALISAMVADTDDFSYGTNPAENNLYYSISGELHQTLMSRFYFYNAFDVVLK